jgi:hypothetical protein
VVPKLKDDLRGSEDLTNPQCSMRCISIQGLAMLADAYGRLASNVSPTKPKSATRRERLLLTGLENRIKKRRHCQIHDRGIIMAAMPSLPGKMAPNAAST